MTMTKTHTKTKTKTMTKTKCLKDPSHAIFSKSMEFKDIKYDTLLRPPESPDLSDSSESQGSPKSKDPPESPD